MSGREPPRILDERVFEPRSFTGEVRIVAIASRVLAGNPLGDSPLRELPVYVPPESVCRGRLLPAVFVLGGFGARPMSALETHPWRAGLVQRYDRALTAGASAPAILALVDGFTALGGSQFMNSEAVGRHEDHLVEELVPLVEARFHSSPERRAVIGKSSGGFGALSLAMNRPGVFRAVAALSPDGAFEHSLWPQCLIAARDLIPFGSDLRAFREELARDPTLAERCHAVMNLLCMSACYAPNRESPLGFDLPIDLATGARREDAWQRFLAHDPLRRVERSRSALSRLDLLHLECGSADEFHLLWAARQLHAKLETLGVPHRYAEHPGGHRGLDARIPPLLDALARALAQG